MNRTDFIIVTAVILFTTFVVGWLMGLIVQRMMRPRRVDMTELDRMAQQLLEAENTRDQAITRMQNREAELTRRVASAETEIQAVLDSLRNSRNEVEELRDYIEKSIARR